MKRRDLLDWGALLLALAIVVVGAVGSDTPVAVPVAIALVVFGVAAQSCRQLLRRRRMREADYDGDVGPLG